MDPEQQIQENVKKLREKGASEERIFQYVTAARKELQPKAPGFFKRVGSDFQKGVEQAEATRKNIIQRQQAGEFGLAGGALRQTGAGIQALFLPAAKAVGAAIGPTVGAAVETASDIGQAITAPASRALRKKFESTEFGRTQLQALHEGIDRDVKSAVKAYNELPEGTKDDVKNVLQTLEAGTVILDAIGVGGATGLVANRFKSLPRLQQARKMKEAIEVIQNPPPPDPPGGAVERPKLPVKEAEIVENIPKIEGKTPSQLLLEAGESGAKPTFRESLADIRPDIKAQVQGKPEITQAYIDVAKARNKNVQSPPVYAYGGERVKLARDKLVRVMNSSGSKIGAFRRQTALRKVPVTQMQKIDEAFTKQLNKLGLEIDAEGKIVKQLGRVGSAKERDITILQELYEELLIAKANPTMQNLIELRNSFTDYVNFAKSVRETTGAIDPLSRKMRGTIANVNRKLVGRNQAKLLEEYSEMSWLIKELNRYVEGRSGGEFLIRQVLSGRGRVPARILKMLEKYTGIDLYDDAVLAKYVTETIGNIDQQNLFRQEVFKAGLDASMLMKISQGKGGAISTLFDVGKAVITPSPEEAILSAAKPKPSKEVFKARREKFKSKKDKGKKTEEKKTVVSKEKEIVPLTERAKKYKNLKEFINKETTKVYHATNKKFEEFDPEMMSHWFTDSKNAAEGGHVGASGKGVVLTRRLDKGLKLATPDLEDKFSRGELSQQGFDGILYPQGAGENTGNFYEIFEASKILKEKDLVNIWKSSTNKSK